MEKNKKIIIATALMVALGPVSGMYAMDAHEEERKDEVAHEMQSTDQRLLINKRLLDGVKTGNIYAVRQALRDGADVNVMIDGSDSALQIAVCSGFIDIVEVLLVHGVNVDYAPSHGYTALYTAVSFSRVEIVKMLILAGANPYSANNRYRRTAFNVADEVMREVMVAAMHQAKMDALAESDEEHETNSQRDMLTVSDALIMAIDEGRLDSIAALLDSQMDVNQKSKNNRIPLHAAVLKGDVEIVRMLLEKQADVNARDCTVGFTALHIAAREGHLEIARMLLEKGAFIDDKGNTFGETPLHCAINNWCYLPRGEERKIAMVRLLLDNNADVNGNKKTYYQTPLHKAVAGGHAEIVKMLVAEGADVIDGGFSYFENR